MTIVEKTLLVFGVLIPASCILPGNTTGLIIGVFVLFSFIFIVLKKISIKKTRAYYLPFLLFYTLYLISVFYSQNTDEAKVKILIKLPLLILPLLLSIYFGSVRKDIVQKILRNYVLIFALSTPYFLFAALYRTAKNGSMYYTYEETGEVISTYFTYAGLTEWVIHPAYLSLWAGTAFLITLFYVIQNKKSILYWTVLICLLLLVLLSQSRMNILALIFVLIVLAIVFLFQKYTVVKSFALLGLFAFISGVILYLLPQKVLGRFSNLTSLHYNIEAETFHEGFNGITIRLAEWKCAFQEIKKRPLFGSGIGDAHYHLRESYKRNNFLYGYREKFNAHNQFIETTLAIGLIGLASLIYIFIPVIRDAIRKKSFHVLAATGYIVLCFLTESYLERQWGVVFLGMMLPTLAESEIALQINVQKKTQ